MKDAINVNKQQLLEQQLQQSQEVIATLLNENTSNDLLTVVTAHLKEDTSKKLGLYFSLLNYMVKELESDATRTALVDFVKQIVPELAKVQKQEQL